MRVLILIDSLDSGGAESMIVSVARHLDRSRVQPVIAGLFDLDSKHRVPSRRILDALADIGVPTRHIGAHNLRDVRGLSRLTELAHSEKIELIHAHLSFSIMWGALASRSLQIPFVATLHGVLDPPRGSRQWMWEQLTRFALRRAARVICVSEIQRAFYTEHTALDAHRWITLYNGIEIDRFENRPEARLALRASLGIPSDVFVITTVALLRPEKGHDTLLAAVPTVLQAFPSAHFLIAGGGPREEALREMARPFGPAVQLVGMRDDIPAILSASDLLVLPSYAEALPTVLLEGMAARLPVIATRVGGVPEIVQDGNTGTLIPPHDVGALAKAIINIMQDSALARAMGEAGRARVQAVFDARQHAEALTQLYEAVLSETAPSTDPMLERTAQGQ